MIEQYGAYESSFDTTSSTRCSRAFSDLVPIKGVAQDRRVAIKKRIYTTQPPGFKG
jgi:hypothetical protein